MSPQGKHDYICTIIEIKFGCVQQMTYDGSASPVLGSKSTQGIRGTFQELFSGKCTIYTVYIAQKPGASNKMGLNFLISCQFVSLELAVAVLMHGSSNAVHV